MCDNYILIVHYTIVRDVTNKEKIIKLQEIQTRIRETIAQSGIKQNVVAQHLDVSAQTVSKYMRCNVLPALDTLAKLCLLTDVSADYILGIKDE